MPLPTIQSISRSMNEWRQTLNYVNVCLRYGISFSCLCCIANRLTSIWWWSTHISIHIPMQTTYESCKRQSYSIKFDLWSMAPSQRINSMRIKCRLFSVEISIANPAIPFINWWRRAPFQVRVRLSHFLRSNWNRFSHFHTNASFDSILDYIRNAYAILSDERQKDENLSIENSFGFRSAYDNTMHTVFTSIFANCLDYIYYSSDRHRLLQVLIMFNKCSELRWLIWNFYLQTVPLPTTNELEEFIGIPSEKFPSDHLALVSDFEWIQNP